MNEPAISTKYLIVRPLPPLPDVKPEDEETEVTVDRDGFVTFEPNIERKRTRQELAEYLAWLAEKVKTVGEKSVYNSPEVRR